MMTEQTPVLNELNNLLGKMMIVGEESCWDYGFLESVIERCKKGKIPTYGQQNVLKDIHVRWSDEAMKSRADFSQNWNEEKEQAFFIALQYYKQTGYYSSSTPPSPPQGRELVPPLFPPRRTILCL